MNCRLLTKGLSDLLTHGPYFALMGLFSKFRFLKFLKINISEIGFVFCRPCSSDFGVIREVLKNECYSFPDFIFAVLQKKHDEIFSRSFFPIIIDAGANIGTASLFLNKLFPKAMILAFEPEKRNFDLAKKNVECKDNIALFNKALGGNEGFASLSPEKSSVSFTTSRSISGVSISTIDAEIRKFPKGEIFLAKIDIEGFEDDLFENNLGWLDQVSCVILEPHDWKFSSSCTSKNFQKAFGVRSFCMFIFGENLLYIRRELFLKNK